MWPRTAEYRRHQEQRIIAHRLEILQHIWVSGWTPPPHKLAKFNLVCSCPMCSYPKYSRQDTERQVWERQELAWGVAV